MFQHLSFRGQPMFAHLRASLASWWLFLFTCLEIGQIGASQSGQMLVCPSSG